MSGPDDVCWERETEDKLYLRRQDMQHLTPGVLDDAAVNFFANGRCASMALALHQLTDWPMIGLFPKVGLLSSGYSSHGAVLSPLGLFDASGPFTAKQWADWNGLEWDDYHYIHLYDIHYARKHLEFVIPFAEALLNRYFPEGWPKQPMEL